MTTKEQIQKDIGNQSALEATMLSEGGQMLLKSLIKDIVSAVDDISLKYKSYSHAELISASAKLAERLVIYRTLKGSTKRKKIAINDLKVFLEENPED